MDTDHQRQQALRQGEETLRTRESAFAARVAAFALREQTQHLLSEAQDEVAVRNSDMRQANQSLVIASLEARSSKEASDLAHRHQDEFLAMLAHELRNPLAPIRSAAALLARLDGTEPVPPMIHQVIERQTKHMSRLLDDLLDASRVTSGKVRLQRRPTDLADFVEQAVQSCRSLLDEQHQNLTVELPDGPVYIDGDPVRLVQVVSNLLHNAAKYTEPGGAIAIRARADEDTVEIRISDDGVGIAPEVLPHIFELFRQHDRSLNRSQGGLGIGLTVVRSMVQLHGGTVEAHSDGVDRGSEFVVTLPRSTDEVADTATTGAEAAERSIATASVLLIDDNVDFAELTALLLRMSGHEVTTAPDGPRGLALFEQLRPQVVVCDIGLPGMDGYQVAQRLRAQYGAPLPLLIAVTGYGGPADHDRSIAAGFDHHLVKPADLEAVLGLIDVFLKTTAAASIQ